MISLTHFATGSVSGMNGALRVSVVLPLLLRGLLLALWSYPAVSMSTLLLLCVVLMGVLYALGCCRQSSWATPSSLHVCFVASSGAPLLPLQSWQS